jgi:hypothetical protein
MRYAMVLVDTAKSAGSTLRDFIFVAACGVYVCPEFSRSAYYWARISPTDKWKIANSPKNRNPSQKSDGNESEYDSSRYVRIGLIEMPNRIPKGSARKIILSNAFFIIIYTNNLSVQSMGLYCD